MPERAHGTNGGYGNWRCRCDRCKAAHADAMRPVMRVRGAAMRELARRHRTEYLTLIDEFKATEAAEAVTIPVDADFAPLIAKLDEANVRMREFMEEWRAAFDAALVEYDRLAANHFKPEAAS